MKFELETSSGKLGEDLRRRFGDELTPDEQGRLEAALTDALAAAGMVGAKSIQIDIDRRTGRRSIRLTGRVSDPTHEEEASPSTGRRPREGSRAAPKSSPIPGCLPLWSGRAPARTGRSRGLSGEASSCESSRRLGVCSSRKTEDGWVEITASGSSAYPVGMRFAVIGHRHAHIADHRAWLERLVTPRPANGNAYNVGVDSAEAELALAVRLGLVHESLVVEPGELAA
jgi:hypothetical protein